MEENFKEQADEDLDDNQREQTSSERTKLFLKKLEIQHKLLQKMLDHDTTGTFSDNMLTDQERAIQHDNPDANNDNH
jgi:7-cyano-7-deazaguanine synthase in queuosine biosynthesis